MNYLWLRSKKIVKRDAAADLFKKLAKKANHLFFNTTCSLWLKKNLNESMVSAKPGIAVDIEFLAEDKVELVEWLRINHANFPWIYIEKEIASAISNNHVFTVLRHNGGIIGYIKVGVNNIYIHDYDRLVKFLPKKAFIYDTFILPEYRRKGLAHHAIIKTTDFLKKNGFEELWCHIEKWNSASLAAFRRAGFREQGDVRFTRLFGIPFFIRDGFRPLAGIEDFIGMNKKSFAAKAPCVQSRV